MFMECDQRQYLDAMCKRYVDCRTRLLGRARGPGMTSQPSNSGIGLGKIAGHPNSGKVVVVSRVVLDFDLGKVRRQSDFEGVSS